MKRDRSFVNQFELPDYPSRFFRTLQGWESIVRLGKHIFFPENKVFVKVGDEIKYCYLVVEGRVMSLEYTSDGEEHIFNIFDKGSIFLESNLLFSAPSAVDFQTVIPTELVRISRSDLLAAMSENVEISLFLLESMSYKYYSAMDRLRENYNHDAMWRVYNLLLLLASNYGKPRGDWTMIDVKLSQQTLGNHLGMSRITVSKILKELKEKEIVELVNGRYCIRNTPPA